MGRADGYRRFVPTVGRAAAEALTNTEYPGIGGGKISAHERNLLQVLSEALGLSG